MVSFINCLIGRQNKLPQHRFWSDLLRQPDYRYSYFRVALLIYLWLQNSLKLR